MVPTARIEPPLALNALIVALQILRDCQYMLTIPTHDCLFGSLIRAPYLSGMASEFRMAVDTCIEFVAAFMLDCDDVEGGMIVRALSLWSDVNSVN